MMMRSALWIASRTPGAGLGVFYAVEADTFDDGFCAAFYEVFLEVERAFVGVDDCGDGLVAHGEDAGFYAERQADGFGGVG